MGLGFCVEVTTPPPSLALSPSTTLLAIVLATDLDGGNLLGLATCVRVGMVLVVLVVVSVLVATIFDD
jgi:hypothetical protein